MRTGRPVSGQGFIRCASRTLKSARFSLAKGVHSRAPVTWVVN